ncbi:MAG: hypothetical protein KGM24_01125, partial [Elusimicrobia bacterium]|nr:hypothetical protein [Elusimicrobiota bacterium]
MADDPLAAARALRASGRHDEAAEVLSAAVDSGGERAAEALAARAEALRAAGRHDEAYADWRRLAELFPR